MRGVLTSITLTTYLPGSSHVPGISVVSARFEGVFHYLLARAGGATRNRIRPRPAMANIVFEDFMGDLHFFPPSPSLRTDRMSARLASPSADGL